MIARTHDCVFFGVDFKRAARQAFQQYDIGIYNRWFEEMKLWRRV